LLQRYKYNLLLFKEMEGWKMYTKAKCMFIHLSAFVIHREHNRQINMNRVGDKVWPEEICLTTRFTQRSG